MPAVHCVLETINPAQNPRLVDIVPFTLASVTYTIDHFEQLRQRILGGRAGAQHTTRWGNRLRGLYNPHDNTLYLSFNQFNAGNIPETLARKAVIIHESIHAIQDMMRASWMLVETSEAAAYVAQYLYVRSVGGSRPSGPVRPEDEAAYYIGQQAWDVGNDIQDARERGHPNPNVPRHTIPDLLDEIRVGCENPGHRTVFNGIPNR